MQLNDFALSSTSNSIDLKYGDVILQSTSEFRLDWKNPKHTFCFGGSAPEHEIIEKCAVSGNGKNILLRGRKKYKNNKKIIIQNIYR